jgi:hypothetical protein
MFALLLLPVLVSGFTNTFSPLSEYEFSWTADETTSKLSVQVKVTPGASKTVGWVGFGIAGGGGGMLGADMFTAYSTGASTCEIQDRSASASEKVLPSIDTASIGGFSDWTLDSCSLSSGVLTVAATRAFVTFDPYDRDFVTGPMELVFAWGQTVPTSPSTITFHNGGYVPKALSLWGEAITIFDKTALESDHDFTFIGMSNVPIGPDTTYTCQGFNLTEKNAQSTLAVAFEPVVAPLANEPYVHHMVLYTCTSPVSTTAFSCFSMPTQCKGILYAWGKGGGPFVLPKVTGVQIGSVGRIYVALQMHYNNPTKVTALVDTSGVNIYRTNMPRTYQSGMFLLGPTALALPPRKSVFTVAGSCPSAITAAGLPDSGVTAYASFMHAHQRGRRIWTDVIRNGVRVATVGNNQNYDFNLQKVQTLTPSVVMKKGDAFNTFCSFDTTADAVTVTFGESTANEMCFNFIAYYPLLGTAPTYPCNAADALATAPVATACSLLPGDPPAAYEVTGWTAASSLFLSGGTAKCKTGFSGIGVIGCAGNGAPFTFSGCTRDSTPEVAPAAAVTIPGVALAVLLCSLVLY